LTGSLIILAFCVMTARSQVAPATDSATAALPRAGATVEALVPSGWSIEQRHEGDFNGDHRVDALLLLRQQTAGSTPPARMLLVAIATQPPGGYQLLAANARLVPTDPSGRLEDPMADGEIVIRRGGFDLKIGMMPTTGSYLAATMRYRFRLEGRCVRLIGFDRNETHRATLETRDVSVNFLTRAVVQTIGNAQSGAVQTRRGRLAANPRRCLPDLTSGWTFDPLAPASR
jgi:hypothetical protein